MTEDHEYLARQAKLMSDQELLERYTAYALTALAQSVTRAEIHARGLSLPEADLENNQGGDISECCSDMVIVARDLTPTEAHLLCSCLHAAGVPAEASDTNLVQAHSLLSVALGGARVRVPNAFLTEALDVIAAFKRGDFALGDDFDDGGAV